MLAEKKTVITVEKPFYFPLQTGRYEVKPGLFRFPYDFGNGPADRLIFQFDSLFAPYRAIKMAAREERIGKYYCASQFDDTSRAQVCRFIVQNLCRQSPAHFALEERDSHISLDCKLSQEQLILDKDYRLIENRGLQSKLNYLDSFDALASQLQEDLAIIRLGDTGADIITALHLCFPNHWSAEDKIGRSFIEAHAPVPKMEGINQSAKKLLSSLIDKGPFVRFAWGIATDTRLNHHPLAPEGVPPLTWQGRAFDINKPELYLRVERQTLHGLPQVRSALFTIRTYFYDITAIAQNPQQKNLLIAAINSMSREDLSYKGLLADKAAIVDWLKAIN